MNPRYSRWLMRLAVVLIVALLGLFWAVSQRTYNLTIENLSEQPIAEVRVSIGGQTQTFHDVKPKAKVTAECPARGDDRFTVEGRLADEKLIRASGRVGESRDFILLPGGELQERRKGSR
jgi:hypothetical protein